MKAQLDVLVALPNVSAPCPVNTCPATMPDGTVVCWPCLPGGIGGAGLPADVPALDTWAALVLAAALAGAAVLRLRR